MTEPNTPDPDERWILFGFRGSRWLYIEKLSVAYVRDQIYRDLERAGFTNEEISAAARVVLDRIGREADYRGDDPKSLAELLDVALSENPEFTPIRSAHDLIVFLSLPQLFDVLPDKRTELEWLAEPPDFLEDEFIKYEFRTCGEPHETFWETWGTIYCPCEVQRLCNHSIIFGYAAKKKLPHMGSLRAEFSEDVFLQIRVTSRIKVTMDDKRIYRALSDIQGRSRADRIALLEPYQGHILNHHLVIVIQGDDFGTWYPEHCYWDTNIGQFLLDGERMGKRPPSPRDRRK